MVRLFSSLILSVALVGCASTLNEDVKARINQLERQLPMNMSLTDAEGFLKESRLPYKVFTQQECEENVKGTLPPYSPKGGPCIFAFSQVGKTWFGYSSDLYVRLFFGPSGNLVYREFHRINTFL
jgi:hypothetical protein